MAHMQRAGHRPIAIIGGGTAVIGDPSGRSDMRQMMTNETIEHNANCFKSQLSKIVDFSEDKALMLNNADWLLPLNYLEFMREIGAHFSVNKMLTAECFKSRLEKGLSFLEFNYMLLQSYDFLFLNRHYNCKLELGGDDQWSNILNGADLIRRKERKQAYGMTFTLLTTSEGKKMGKTQKGALWLDPNKTSPYEFYQYWVNVDDADVLNCMKLITFVPMDEIREMEKWEGKELNEAKKRLAYEVTALVHGEIEAQNAKKASEALFGGASADGSDVPSTQTDLDEIGILDALVATKLAPSKAEARRLVAQGGVVVDDDKVSDISYIITSEKLTAGVLIKKGKKGFHKLYK